jgi:hypothetical protein
LVANVVGALLASALWPVRALTRIFGR